MTNLEQKYYEGFLKAAMQSGVPYPNAMELLKQANPLMGALRGLGGQAKGLLEKGKGMQLGAGALGGAGLGLGAGIPIGSAMGYDNGLAAGEEALKQMAQQPLPPANPTPTEESMPDWAKMLLAGGVGGGLGLGAAGLMGGGDEEEQPAGVPAMQGM